MDIIQEMAVHFGVSLSDMHPLVVSVSTLMSSFSEDIWFFLRSLFETLLLSSEISFC